MGETRDQPVHRLSGAGHHAGTMNAPREDQSTGQESFHAEAAVGSALPMRTTLGLPAGRAKLRDRRDHSVQILAASRGRGSSLAVVGRLG